MKTSPACGGRGRRAAAGEGDRVAPKPSFSSFSHDATPASAATASAASCQSHSVPARSPSPSTLSRLDLSRAAGEVTPPGQP
jgi:hypothetical protein